MKTRFSRRQQGSTIFVTLFIAGLVALTLTAYLSWSDTQNKLATRAQRWNAALPVVEAGIEEALVHLNFSTSRTTNGWSLSNTNYIKERTFGDGYYVVKVSTNEPPVIVSQGFVRAPFQTNIYVSRSVVVTCSKNPGSAAILAKGAITLSGSPSVDSFDSSNPLYSTLGIYDASKKEDHASVQSNSGAVGTISAGGSSQIYGSVATGPGGSVTVGVNASIGDTAWQAANTKGIEPGAFVDTVNASFPDNPAPFTNGGFGLPGGGLIGGLLGGITYTYIFSSGNYKIGALTLTTSQSILIAGPGTTILYCDGGITEVGQSSVTIAPGASLKLYVNNGPISLTGGGLMNNAGLASNCAIYGMTNCTSVKLAGNSALIATINAPEASVTVGGTAGFSGAVVANDVTIAFGTSFHYDEALARVLRIYVASSWNEF